MSTKNLVIITTCLLFITSAHSFAATLNVPSAPYPTIQTAVNAVSNGDTIEVASGTYADVIFGASFNADNVLLKGDATNKPEITGGIDFAGYPNIIDGLTIQNFVIKGNLDALPIRSKAGMVYAPGIEGMQPVGMISRIQVERIRLFGDRPDQLIRRLAIQKKFDTVHLKIITGTGREGDGALEKITVLR